MQISKITQPIFPKAPTIFKAQAEQTTSEAGSNPQIPDNYGRAMVNFKACATPRILCKQDKALMETLSDTLNLTITFPPRAFALNAQPRPHQP